MDYEAIVIGCGPAGLSAAIYLGRAEVKTIIVGKYKDSQLMKAHLIENYYGFPEGIKGPDLLKKGIQQVKKFKVKIFDHEVVSAKQLKDGFKVKMDDGTQFTSKVLVVATGTPIRLSGILNEEKFTGKGLHYCVECDAAFYKEKNVAIVGNGNHAAENAIDLHVFTPKVTIISNGNGFSFSKPMEKEIKKLGIKLIDKKISAFEGKKFLDTVVYDNKEKASFDGVFMACGTASALDFASTLGLVIKGNILEINNENMTSIQGIFAAGNCAGKCRQVARNIGDGCNAAVNAIKYLRNKKIYVDYSRGG